MNSLKGKTAVVTGSKKGIGFAIAREFASEGAQVLINDLKSKDGSPDVGKVIREVIDQFGSNPPIIFEADLTVEEDVFRLAGYALKEFKKIDIWVNNVGSHIVTPALDQSKKNWDEMFAVNATSTFLGCREAARVMKDTGGGVIINIASKMGLVGSPENACYCSAKAAVVMMTRCLGAEWAPFHIRVNAIAPGVTWTGPTNKVVDGKPDLEAALHYRIPMERFARPEEIAKVAVFLASDSASYITGETIVCDGGWVANSDFAGIPPGKIDVWKDEFPRAREQ
jgi:NAD(P)-dependent dehydrogenase (short-subunit alcohol dehydrogenase family)